MKNAYESENIIANVAWRNPDNPIDYHIGIQITVESFERIVKLAAAGLCEEDYVANEELINQLGEIRHACK